MAQHPIKSATINDVARLSGVSYQTVSRVINEHPNVKADTRERVMDAVKALHFQPNAVARSLSTKRSTTIGIIVYGAINNGPAQTMSSVEAAARERGYTSVFSSVSEMSLEALRPAVQTLHRQHADGLLFISSKLPGSINQLEALCQGIPFVFSSVEPDGKVPATLSDEHLGGRMAVQHLLELGHREIALISGSLEWVAAQMRLLGASSALQQAGLEAVAHLEGDWSSASGYQATQQLLKSKRFFTGIVAANDQMALGALRALHKAKIKVPQEVSVVGWDDLAEGAFFEPPLTTIRQDFALLGRKNLEHLIGIIEGTWQGNNQEIIPPTLVVRHSTAKPRSTP